MKTAVIALLVSGLAVTAAKAEVVVFDYTAVITATEVDRVAVSGFQVAGKTFTAGYTLRGSFSVDLDSMLYDWRPDAPGAWNNMTYKGDANVAELSVDQTGYHFKSAPSWYNSGFQISNSDSGDVFSYESSTFISTPDGYTGESLMFQLSDRTGNLVPDASPPSQLSLEGLHEAQLSYWFSSSPGATYQAIATLTSLTPQVSNVPEPETYAMLGLGLLTLGAVARRRQRRGARA